SRDWSSDVCSSELVGQAVQDVLTSGRFGRGVGLAAQQLGADGGLFVQDLVTLDGRVGDSVAAAAASGGGLRLDDLGLVDLVTGGGDDRNDQGAVLLVGAALGLADGVFLAGV